MVKSQIAFHGIQEANGFELLRLLRKEFSLLSRPEALQYKEACLKFPVKKADRHRWIFFAPSAARHQAQSRNKQMH